MRNFTALDTETTGLQGGSRVVELAAVRVRDGDAVDSFHAVVNPGMPIPADITAINGATDDSVKEGLPTRLALLDFLTWLGEDVLVAHNAGYDVGIINWSAQCHEVPWPRLDVVDTLEIAKAMRLTKKNGLDTLVEFHGIHRKGEAHRALSDAYACADYFLLNQDAKYTVRPWDSLIEYEYAPPVPACLVEKVRDGEPLAFTYTDDKGQSTERTITPYGWCSRKGLMYFHGLCHLRGERREFRADRATF